MTTDIVQNAYIAKKLSEIDAKPAQKGRFLTGSRDFFGFLKKEQPVSAMHTSENDLLKVAYTMLEQAEQNLEAKDQRIKNLEGILTIDELTSLTNRRGFYEAFKREIDLTNRGNNQGGILIMIDLDFFKTINDTFGHRAGDEALRMVGNFLQDTMRKMDVAARIGGDEFIVLFPNTTISQSLQRVEKLGEDINALSFTWQNTPINIKASLGLKEYKQGDTIEDIVEEADKCMYLDKERKQQTKH